MLGGHGGVRWSLEDLEDLPVGWAMGPMGGLWGQSAVNPFYWQLRGRPLDEGVKGREGYSGTSFHTLYRIHDACPGCLLLWDIARERHMGLPHACVLFRDLPWTAVWHGSLALNVFLISPFGSLIDDRHQIRI